MVLVTVLAAIAGSVTETVIRVWLGRRFPGK
jgi:membrane protein DedA with SNARE-associated domain